VKRKQGEGETHHEYWREVK